MATFQMNYLSMKIGMQTNFTVILPGDSTLKFKTADSFSGLYPRNRKYKTLWLLHSEEGDDSEILRYSGILRYAEKLGFAVVMPCCSNWMYSDEPSGQKFFELFTQEQRIICHNYFPLSDKREDNFIGGVSLGAYGALKAALTYPGYYSAALIIDGAFGKNLKSTYLERIRTETASLGLVPPSIQDEAPPEKAELYDIAVKMAADRNALPEIYWAWGSENTATGVFSRSGAEALKELGYIVKTKEYKGCGRGWDSWDPALCDAVCEWLPQLGSDRGGN